MCTKTLKENSGIFFPTIHTKGINIIIILTLSCLFENIPRALPIWSANKKKSFIILRCLEWVDLWPALNQCKECWNAQFTWNHLPVCTSISFTLTKGQHLKHQLWTLYSGQFMLSTQLITLIKITLLYYPTDTPPVSLETYPCYAPASGLLHNYHHDNWLNP